MRRLTVKLRWLVVLMATGCVLLVGPDALSAKKDQRYNWKYATETKHYYIFTNISRSFLKKAEKTAEIAFTKAVTRLDVNNDNPEFIKNIERTCLNTKKLVETWDNGTKQYKLPNDIILNEFPQTNYQYQLIFPDGRQFTFWRNSMYGRNIKIYLCKDKAELKLNLKNSVPGSPRGGWYLSEGKISIEMPMKNGKRRLDNLVHEINHQVMNYVLYDIPCWLDEGMAMYSGIDEEGEFREGLIREDQLKMCMDSLKDDTFLPIEELMQLEYNEFHHAKREKYHYAQSWALVHLLFHSEHPVVKGTFQKYLHELKKGNDPLESFKKIYDIDEINKGMPAYLKSLYNLSSSNSQVIPYNPCITDIEET